MVVLEDLFAKSEVNGIVPGRTVTILGKTKMASDLIKVWYRYDDEPNGPKYDTLLTRDHEATLDMVKIGEPVAGPPDPNPDHYTLGKIMQRGDIVPPLRLEAPYVDDDGKTHTFQARVYRDGYIVCEYKIYPTLRMAANAALRSMAEKSGRRPKLLQGDSWDFWRFREQDDGPLVCVRVLRNSDDQDNVDNQVKDLPLETDVSPIQPTVADAPPSSAAECSVSMPPHVRAEIVPGHLYIVSVPSDATDESRRALSHAFHQLAHREKADIRCIDIGSNVPARLNLSDADMDALTKIVSGWRKADNGMESLLPLLREAHETIGNLLGSFDNQSKDA